MRALRWALVPIAALVSWAVSLFFGILLHDVATRLCPDAEMVSGACVAPWWPIADAVVLCLSAAFAAALIVIGCSLTAPSDRPRVALVVYVLGAVWAVIMAVAGAAYLALPAAGIAGWLAVAWIRKRGP